MALRAPDWRFVPRFDVAAPVAGAVDLVVSQAAVVQVGPGLVQLCLGLRSLCLALSLPCAGGLLGCHLAMLVCQLAAAVLELTLMTPCAHTRQDHCQQYEQDQHSDDDCDDRSG